MPQARSCIERHMYMRSTHAAVAPVYGSDAEHSAAHERNGAAGSIFEPRVHGRACV